MSAALLVRVKDRITAAYMPAAGNWQQIMSDPADCLIVAFYGLDIPESGDHIILDLTKYVGRGNVKADLGIASVRKIDETSAVLWTLRGAQGAVPAEVPLIFRRLSLRHDATIDTLISGLLPWMKLLDRVLKVPAASSGLSHPAWEFLNDLRAKLSKGGRPAEFEQFLKDPAFQSRYSFRVENVRTPVVATYLWAE